MKKQPIPTLHGKQFGRWTVVGASGSLDQRLTAKWACKCSCGTVRPVLEQSLVQGKSTNCGCVRREAVAARNFKHGGSARKAATAAYTSWKHMWQRCSNPKCKDFRYYGGRGITICPEWRDFSVFLRDMGEPAKGLTIDRIKVDKGYSLGNCQWATRAQQTANRRCSIALYGAENAREVLP